LFVLHYHTAATDRHQLWVVEILLPPVGGSGFGNEKSPDRAAIAVKVWKS
jgi:hypothetical protein